MANFVGYENWSVRCEERYLLVYRRIANRDRTLNTKTVSLNPKARETGAAAQSILVIS